MKNCTRTKMLQRVLLVAVLTLTTICISPQVAHAEDPDVMLGVFFNTNDDRSDTLYMSVDGYNFYKLATALEDDTPNGSGNHAAGRPSTVYTFSDPSIICKDGGFYMISGTSMGNYSNGTARAIPMIGYSEDLVNWSCGNSGFFNLEDNLIPATTPPGQEKWQQYDKWDFGSADFFADDDGTVWVYFSLGYYADYHGDDFQNDIMAPYLAKITNLKPDSSKSLTDPGWQPDITYESQYAKQIVLPKESNNRIDGSIYKENGWYYLSIKENGIINELWRTRDLNKCDDPNAWELVSPNMQGGSEGPSLTSLNGTYYMFSDKLAPWPAMNEASYEDNQKSVFANVTSGIGAYGDNSHGVYVCTSSNINDPYGWSGTHKIQTYDTNGNIVPNRHGTVITVTDSAAKAKIWNLYRSQYSRDPSTTGHPLDNGWVRKDYKEFYWYENGVRQGYDSANSNYRGKEIYDPSSDAWYWLDNVQGGAMAYNKDVYQDSKADDAGNIGKWVRYDYYGHMIKGEQFAEDSAGNWDWYYFNPVYGTMAKGLTTLSDGRTVYYDDATGKMLVSIKTNESTGEKTTVDYYVNGSLFLSKENGEVWQGWYSPDGNKYYWYENGIRQGYNPNDPTYRGKEILDPQVDKWFWLDNVQQGAKAVSKDVYQESNGGKWVRYDAGGSMIKGWDNFSYPGSTYYFDPITGAMAKGEMTINGETWFFADDGRGTRIR